MPGLDNKISNIIGAALPSWLKKQLWTRYTENSLQNRSDDNLIYLANKTAWIRVVSSVNINGSVTAATQNPNLSLLGDIQYFSDTLGLTNIREPQDLAKQYVLFGGTSKYLGANNESGNYQLRSGIDSDGAYAMLGENEVKQYGYRPMPGITGAQIETQGRLGSVRMATINFKVWDKVQLDIIDTLYFKLGYTMLIEWANTVYPTKDENSENVQYNWSEFLSIDPFFAGATKESINAQIGINMRKSEGNYDGMLGMVTNFNFTFNQEGGYDCSIKVIGLGSLADSIKINNASALEEVAKEQIKGYVNLIDKLDAEKAYQEALAKQTLENKVKEIEIAQKIAAATSGINAPRDLITLLQDNTTISQYYIDSYGYVNDTFVYNSDSPYSNEETVYTVMKLKAVIASGQDYLKGTKIKIDINRANSIYRSLGLNGIGSTITDAFFNDPPIKDFTNSKNNYKGNNFTVFSTGNVRLNSEGLNSGTISAHTSDIYYINNNITSEQLKKSNFSKSPKFNLHFGIRDNISYGNATQNPFDTKLNKKGYNELSYLKIGGPDDFVDFENETVKNLWNDPGIEPIIYKSFGIDYNGGNSIVDLISNAINDLSREWNLTNIVPINSAGILPIFELSTEIKFSFPVFNLNKITSGKGYSNILMLDNVEAKLKVYIRIDDVGLISGLSFGSVKPVQTIDFEKAQIQAANQDTIDHTVIEPHIPDEATKTQQVESALKNQSNLELVLRAIEMYSLSKNIYENNQSIDNPQMSVFELTNEGNLPFLKKIFSNGIYREFFYDLISSNGITIDNAWGGGETYIQNYKKSPDNEKMQVLAKYGFASAILGGNEQGVAAGTEGVPKVDYQKLLVSYVIPYTLNDSSAGDIRIVYPTYIQLGFLLMIINDLCTIYEAGEDGISKHPKPIVYVDYNPETNRCLSQPAQFSTNPFDFMIKNQCPVEKYAELFPSSIIDKNKNVIIKSSETGSTDTNLFNVSKDDYYSNKMPNFRDNNNYSGKHMRILVSIEYILNVIKEYTKNDGTNSVYLKPFLERICKDMNNYLGAINVFRVAYYDSSNTLCIVDDHVQPLPKGQVPIDKSGKTDNTTYSDELPLYGLTSIARSISIQTEVSSKLGSMIAISANSKSEDQASMGKNAGSFGFYNTAYKDRYIPTKTTATDKTLDDKKNKIDNKLDSLISAATMFNNTIKSIYGSRNPSKDNITQATNFYIDSINKVQNNNPATRASVMIPVSVTFTTDGISGFHMGSAFTIPEKMLPYTYSTRKTPEMREGKKVGFASVGVSHTIANNTWETSIKGQMIFLKDPNEFSGEVSQIQYTTKKLPSTTTNNIIPDTYVSAGNNGIRALATVYGYPGDTTGDPNSLKAIGNRNNKLIEGSSVALKESTAKYLNIPLGGKVKVTFKDNTTGIFSYDDTIPEYDAGVRVDFYQPKIKANGNILTGFKYNGDSIIVEKV